MCTLLLFVLLFVHPLEIDCVVIFCLLVLVLFVHGCTADIFYVFCCVEVLLST